MSRTSELQEDLVSRRDLSAYRNDKFSPGRSALVRSLWYLCSLVAFESGWLPISRPKCWLLRRFGASIGRGVVIKPNVRIKFPWRLAIGDHSWIGQEVWIDNLAAVRIGSNVCVSQGAYLCTGSHDHRRPTFDLITREIEVSDRCWIGARATLLGGITIGWQAVVSTGSVVTQDVLDRAVVGGVPAREIRQ